MNIFQIFVIIDADKFQLVFTEIKNGMALQKICCLALNHSLMT